MVEEIISSNIMINVIFEDAIKNKSLIGIRTSAQDWDETIIGFIIEKENSSILIKEIDEFGRFIGNTNLNIDEIISIDINDRYQRKLAYTHENRATFNEDKKVTIWNLGVLKEHMANLLKDKTIATFFFSDDNYVIGILLDYDNEFLKLKNIGDDGLEDGYSFHLIDELSGLRFNGLHEQKVQLLLNFSH